MPKEYLNLLPITRNVTVTAHRSWNLHDLGLATRRDSHGVVRLALVLATILAVAVITEELVVAVRARNLVLLAVIALEKVPDEDVTNAARTGSSATMAVLTGTSRKVAVTVVTRRPGLGLGLRHGERSWKVKVAWAIK